jgi:hypothetical protein
MRALYSLTALFLSCIACYCAAGAWGQSGAPSAKEADSRVPAPQLRPEPAPSPQPAAEPAGSTTSTPPAPPAPDKGAVESFFQLKHAIITAGKQDRTADNQSAGKAIDRHNKGLSRTAFGSLQHILDWVGMPLFFVKEDALDPSIDKYSALPPPVFLDDKRPGKATAQETNTDNHPNDTDASKHKEIIPRKIPESELEGTTNDNPANAIQKP